MCYCIYCEYAARKALSRVCCFDRGEDRKQNERESKSNKVWKNPVEVRLFSFFSSAESSRINLARVAVARRCHRGIAFANSRQRIPFKIGFFDSVHLLALIHEDSDTALVTEPVTAVTGIPNRDLNLNP